MWRSIALMLASRCSWWPSQVVALPRCPRVARLHFLLLDPINVRLGAALNHCAGLSRRAPLRPGDQPRRERTGVCGVLWEFWNYWACDPSGITSVPIMSSASRSSKCRCQCYLGFPAFALECFTMYVFVRQVFVRTARPDDCVVISPVARIKLGRCHDGASLEREIKRRFESADGARAAVRCGRARRRFEGRPLAGRLPARYFRRLASRTSVRPSRVRVEAGKMLSRYVRTPPGCRRATMQSARRTRKRSSGTGLVLLTVARRARVAGLVPVSEVSRGVHHRGCDRGDRRNAGWHVYVEIEGGDRRIADVAEALGRGPADYLLDSYRRLFVMHGAAIRGDPGHRHAVRRRRGWQATVRAATTLVLDRRPRHAAAPAHAFARAKPAIPVAGRSH